MGPELLEARDARQALLDAVRDCAGGGAVLLLGTNVPGPAKHRPGLAGLVRGALESLQGSIGLDRVTSGRDLLGPYHLAFTAADPRDAKRHAVALETGSPAGRLLDLDVHAAGGAPVDRAALGLGPRACFLCAEPARECILLARHSGAELLDHVDALLRPFRPRLADQAPGALAGRLHRGALEELNLTPKPGLVDRSDSGSHPDLTFEAMRASADLLPRYYQDLLECFRQGRPQASWAEAGREAEARMMAAAGSNAHRGYIFLSGLVLAAACAARGRAGGLREEIAAAARRHFAGEEGPRAGGASHGALARALHGLGGIRAEAEAGLPAIFDHALPNYLEALAAGWAEDHARFYAMAALMQRVEDTTAVHRCGPEGLRRLREDGAALQRLLEKGHDPVPWLAGLNEAYRAMGLTMGGVADCLAITFALAG